MKRFLTAFAFFAALVGLWQGLCAAGLWSPVLVPSPVDVLRYLRDIALDGSLWSSSVVTLKRLLAGYVLGLIAGVPLGLLSRRAPPVAAVFDRLVGEIEERLGVEQGGEHDEPIRLVD